ncbi:MAG: phosphatidate cytidylyltransferase [Clostridiales bacterium]|nr:phosphatidate cytidylyltransferase [Clostridiales bacterium]
MKRTLTSIVLIVVLAAFMVCGYFVSPIFIDMLILLFMAGAAYEMRKCLKEAGFEMYVTPMVFMLILAYPTFYLLQHFVGGVGNTSVSAGIQGLLFVLLIGVMCCLCIFTFKPAFCNRKRAKEAEQSSSVSNENCDGGCECLDSSSTNASVCESATSENIGKSRLSSLFANIFVLVYPILFLSVAWIVSFKYSAFFAVLFAVLVPIIGSDMFAFFVGKAIGGKKLCPTISPKKTVAGAIGGLFGGIIIAILFWVIFEYVGNIAPSFVGKCGYTPFISHDDGGWMWKSALIYLAIGLICGVVAEIGDLSASAIKRAIGIKDYGKIFPGHGGFMDRIDSAMYCLVILLVAFTCIYGY